MAEERLRWCKKCKVVFEGKACLEGHPNFMYTRRIPKEAGAPHVTAPLRPVLPSLLSTRLTPF